MPSRTIQRRQVERTGKNINKYKYTTQNSVVNHVVPTKGEIRDQRPHNIPTVNDARSFCFQNGVVNIKIQIQMGQKDLKKCHTDF